MCVGGDFKFQVVSEAEVEIVAGSQDDLSGSVGIIVYGLKRRAKF